MKYLTDEMISGLLPAETSSFPSPVPTQIVSSDEFEPVPQTLRQREVEARLIDLSDRLARLVAVSRPGRRTPALSQMIGPGSAKALSRPTRSWKRERTAGRAPAAPSITDEALPLDLTRNERFAQLCLLPCAS